MSRRIRKRKDSTLLTEAGNLSKQARKLLDTAQTVAASLDNKMFAEMYLYAVKRKVYDGNPRFLEFIKQLREPPVSIEDFLDSKDFMGATDLSLWPEVRKAIIAINKDWWKGWKVAKNEALLMGACVDADTEFLTPTGWKRIAEYEQGDLVGQYAYGGELSFVEPQRYVKRRHNMFYHFNPRGGLDMMLTPGHRVIYENCNTDELMEMPAEDVAYKQNTLANGFKGKFLSTFRSTGRAGLAFTDEQIRVMVMVHADGSFYEENSSWCNLILKKERKIARAIELLEDAEISYVRTDHDGGEYQRIKFYAPERNKTFNGWWEANREQLSIIVDEVMLWDGSEYHQQFYTAKKEEADFIQYAMLATGHRATMQWQDRGGNRSIEYRVKLCRTPTYSMSGNNPSIAEFVEASDGYCYCFTLDTGMWLMRRNGNVCVTGNTGTGKSEISKVTQAYHLHILGCMNKPQRYWSLPEATSIVITIQAAKPHVTKRMVYSPLRTYIETMPWFQRHMRPNKLLEGEMYFDDQNIRVVQGGSDSDAVLGDALVGGVVDEINFMNVVEKSKKAGLGTGRSGSYDQAQSVYDTITRRKKSRFLSQGPNIGVFCIASSTRYKGDFTDRRKKQVVDLADSTTYVYDKAQYDVRPKHNYSGETFRLLTSTSAASDIRVLEDDEVVHDGVVLDIPIEHKEDFLKDPSGAMRDIVGKSANAVNPFIRQQAKVMACVAKGEDAGIESILIKDNVVLGFEGMPVVKRGHYCRNPSKPRYVHIDLSNTGDRCGIAMLRFEGIEWVTRSTGEAEALPIATVELAVTIEPDHGNEIDLAEVRSWVKQLRNQYGYPIKAVTYDGWNSLESRQAWKRQGMKTGAVSVDRSSAPYKQLRDALYDGRILMYRQEVLLDELFNLEYDENKDKVDHPVNGGKDCADAVCGAYFTLASRASSWSMPTDGVDLSTDHRMDLGDRMDYDRPA